jgi:hypothetical protein
VGASWAEAVVSEARKARQIKRFVAEAVDDLIRWSVVEAVPPSPSLRQAKEALNRRSDPRCFDLQSRIAAQARFPTPGQQFCREIFREIFGNRIERSTLAGGVL